MKVLMFATIFLLLLIPLASAEPWWNSSWTYRRSINITNNNLAHVLEEEFK